MTARLPPTAARASTKAATRRARGRKRYGGCPPDAVERPEPTRLRSCKTRPQMPPRPAAAQARRQGRTSDASDTGSHVSRPDAARDRFHRRQSPDLQDLVNGAKPGKRSVVLDPRQDGVSRSRLSGGERRGHGLRDQDLVARPRRRGENRKHDPHPTPTRRHAAALAGIGRAALAPGGEIPL